MPELEKYRGNRSRHTCPSCGQKKQFARYIDDSGEYISDEVGRCNRESSCGYHLTPKEYFSSRNVQCSRSGVSSGMNKVSSLNISNTSNASNTSNTVEQIEHFDTIDNSFVVRALAWGAKNRFLNFLLSFIDAELVEKMARRYFIGTTRDGRTVFWQLDQAGRARTGKIISYVQETGKRDKKVYPSWVHYELKKHKLLPETFVHQLCFFGEHLLRRDTNKPVAIVEAEKTAAVASVFIDKFIWLAAGGKSYLKAERLRRFKKRKIVLFPDADGYELWEREAADARAVKLNVTTSRIIEDSATEDEKRAGFDLADYLILNEIKAQRHNFYAENYNSKVDEILTNEERFEEFNVILDERMAIAEESGFEPSMVLRQENAREIVNRM
ncbi:MAG TPA: DUF6371 domain-containing protein [Pyrinomonadaceae bacterium]|jgi:hypothetical protein